MDGAVAKIASLFVIIFYLVLLFSVIKSGETLAQEHSKLIFRAKSNKLVSERNLQQRNNFVRQFFSIQGELLIIQVINQPIRLQIFNKWQLNNEFFYEFITMLLSYVIVSIQYDLNVWDNKVKNVSMVDTILISQKFQLILKG